MIVYFNYWWLFLILILNHNLNIDINDSDPVIIQFAYGVLLISLVAFFCYINIADYVIIIYLIQKVIMKQNILNLQE